MQLFEAIRQFEGGLKEVAEMAGIAPINVKRILKDQEWKNKDVEEKAILFIKTKIEHVQKLIEN